MASEAKREQEKSIQIEDWNFNEDAGGEVGEMHAFIRDNLNFSDNHDFSEKRDAAAKLSRVAGPALFVAGWTAIIALSVRYF